jgi:isoamylase
LTWHGVKVGQPDWGTSSHSIAFTVEMRDERLTVHLIANAYWESLDFELPRVDKTGEDLWRRWIDTALDSPNDIVPWDTAASVTGYAYRAEARSVVVLFAGVYTKKETKPDDRPKLENEPSRRRKHSTLRAI